MVINFNKKRRRIAFFIFITILLAVLFLVIKNTLTNKEVFSTLDNSIKNNYIIDVVFDDKQKLMKCNQNITYINTTDSELDKLYFHIYPNAFSKKELVPFEKEQIKKAYPDGFDKGYINIENLLNNTTNLEYNIIGEKNDILEVKLSNKLKPGDKYSIDIKYNVKIPKCTGRFGYGDDTINITNWFPICCVYKDCKWSIESYETIGDPFYSDISDFTVNILLPKKYTIASTGLVVDEKTNKNERMYKLQANSVRDFAIILSDKFIVNKSMSENISILTYSLNKNLATRSNEIAKRAIDIFSDIFGEYPYECYSVVASDFFIGGMEYPSLSMIDHNLYNKQNFFLLEYVIAHETAHQWWYGLVGNDEVKNPWIDEALTEYSTVLYFEKVYGKEISEQILKTMKIQSKRYDAEDIFMESKDFENSSEYSLNVYTKGAIVFNEIRNNVGDKLFFDTLKAYYKAYKFKNVSKEEFIRFWRNKGIDIENIIDKLD